MKITIKILLLISLIGMLGCDREIDSKNPTRTLLDGNPTPFGLEVVMLAEEVKLQWDITTSGEVDFFRVYAASNEPVDFQLYDSTMNTELTIDDLGHNKSFFFKVAAVFNNGLEGNHSEYATIRSGITNLLINDNDKFTNSTNVTLNIIGPGSISHVIYSEDSTFADAVYMNISTSINYDLSLGDGIKTVYANFKFNDAVSGQIYRDSIILDTKAAIDSVYFKPSNVTFGPGDTISFYVVTSESNGSSWLSFSSLSRLDLYDDGLKGDVIADDGIYSAWFVVPSSMNVNSSEVGGHFRDQAGNEARQITAAELLFINVIPDPVDLLVQYNSGDSATFSWTATTAPDFESYRLYQSADNNVTTDDTLINYTSGSSERTYKYLPPTGTSYYRIFVFDKQGASAGSNTIQLTAP